MMVMMIMMDGWADALMDGWMDGLMQLIIQSFDAVWVLSLSRRQTM